MNHWQENIDLAPLCTFGVPALARYFVRAQNAETAINAYRQALQQQIPVLVLGGGSNVLFTQNFEGLVILMAERGIQYRDEGDAVLVTAAAGEPWHGFVLDTIEQGLCGLENLSLIPGTVGAAPMQNIGAYGVEIKDVFYQLQAWDSQEDKLCTFNLNDCAFAYRDSHFKRHLGRYLILNVTFALSRNLVPQLEYGDIRNELTAQGINTPSARDISQAVIAIRSRKLPDPAVIGNAGSFFKNPIVSASIGKTLLDQSPQAPHWTLPDGQIKFAAGWLIDQCGWKGRSLGQAGVYEKQALVLVNRGGAQGAEVRDLSRAIQVDVLNRFGVALEAEPLIL